MRTKHKGETIWRNRKNMINENTTVQNLDNYLNDFLQRDQKKDLKPLSTVDIETMYMQHLAKAYDIIFNSIGG